LGVQRGIEIAWEFSLRTSGKIFARQAARFFAIRVGNESRAEELADSLTLNFTASERPRLSGNLFSNIFTGAATFDMATCLSRAARGLATFVTTDNSLIGDRD